MGTRLDQLERRLRSLRFAIQAAEQQSLELTFRLEAQGMARYENVRCTSSAGGRIIPAHMWTLLDAGERKITALVWIHGGVHGHLAFYYWRLIREMVEERYVVLAPEYRASTHDGRSHYNAVDYGGFITMHSLYRARRSLWWG